MKLFVLKRLDLPGTPRWDVADGFVVRARNENRARLLCSLKPNTGDEGSAVWLSQSMSSCEELTKTGPEEVILRDFNAA